MAFGLTHLSIICFLLVPTGGALAQLSGAVGQTTDKAAKANICSVLDYGGKVGSSVRSSPPLLLRIETSLTFEI